MDLILRGGLLVHPDRTETAAVAVRDGRIVAVGEIDRSTAATETIDARGKLVLPGLVDSHVHTHWPFLKATTKDDFCTGTIAAAFGGTTTIVDWATQKNCLPLEGIARRRAQADGQVVVDYALHCVLTELSDEVVRQLPQVVEQGVPSFKMYMTYRKRGIMVDDAMLVEVMNTARRCGGLVMVHAENAPISEYREDRGRREGQVSPYAFKLSKDNLVEAEAVNRALFLNQWVGSDLFVVHLSTGEGAAMIRRARQEGQRVWAETCPQYLALTDEVYKRDDGRLFLCSPPIKSEADRDALWRALADGTVSVVGTDHAAYDREQKAIGEDVYSAANGLPGVETRLPVVFMEGVIRGRISLNRMVEVLAANPARVFGLYPRKGAIAPGSDADLVVFDPEAEWTIRAGDLHQQVDWCPYEGMAVRGRAEVVIARGEVILRNGQFSGQRGRGRFLAGTRRGWAGVR